MPDPRTPDTLDNAPADVTTNPDDGFNRRLGLGLVISIGANVLLLQGAGVMAKNMSLNAPTNDTINVVLRPPAPSPKPTESPSPSPSPSASPSAKPTPRADKPTPKPKESVKPTPKPKPSIAPPSATPPPEKPATPTPEPIQKRTIATPTPNLTPEKTPDVKVPTPAPDITKPVTPEKIASAAHKTLEQALTPAIAMTPTEHSATLKHNLPKLGTSTGPKSAPTQLASRTNAPAFKAPTLTAAPTPTVNSLATPTLASSVVAMFHPTTSSIHTATNSTAEVTTQDHSTTTSQLMTHAGHATIATSRVAVMTSTRTSSVAPTFVLPTAGGTVKPGQHLSFQGSSASSTTAQLAASSRSDVRSSTNQEVVVNSSATTSAVGPVGIFRPNKRLSTIVSEVAGDHSRVAGGAASTIALNAGSVAGGNTTSHLTTASVGTTTAAYSPNAGRNANLQSSSNAGINAVADSGGSVSGRNLQVASASGHARPAGARATSVGGGGTLAGDGAAGPIGIRTGVVNGGGNGPGFKAGALNGGSEHGFGTTAHAGTLSSSVTVNVDSDGGSAAASKGVPAPKSFPTADSLQDVPVGKTYGARYVLPTTPAIPESLKSTAFDVKVTVRLSFGADGQCRASIVKSSGYKALDDVVANTFSRTKFKPAYENGSPIDDSRDITLTFTNKG